MLTKDLIRYRIKGKQIYPTFIDTGAAYAKEMAGLLLDVFLEAPGRKRAEIEEQSLEICEAFPTRLLIARGLRKLLMDRCEFEQPVNDDFIALRSDVFAKSAQYWRAAQSGSAPATLDNHMAAAFDQPAEELRETLYADLPEHQAISRFRKLSVQQLLDRYNVAQVQGLLITSRALTIELHSPTAETVRQLIKHLRFRQLLADIDHREGERLTLQVDGPMNLFFQTQKYGLNLAFFFPAILHHQHWRLEATVQPKRRKLCQLNLDQDSGLQPWSHHFSSYVPEEVKQFQAAFQEKVSDWEIKQGTEFLNISGENYCFPDYQLQHETGSVISLELFHPWHAGQLLKRLAALEVFHSKPPLIMGISRALVKKQDINDTLENSPYFQKWGFLFRDIPAVSKVDKALKALVQTK